MERTDSWSSGDPYEYFMGRWSRLMAPVFLDWVRAPVNLSWLDIGCGTGALSEAIARHGNPGYLCGVDPSEAYIEKAKQKKTPGADFVRGSAGELPVADHSFDIVVSGLALNFFPDLAAALNDIKRVMKKKATFAAYVWDYAGRMEFLRYFWDVVVELDADAAALEEGNRFPVCREDQLQEAFRQAGFTAIETSMLDVDTVFTGFDDYWNPFLGGQGPAPGYLASVDKVQQDKLKAAVKARLPVEDNGSIKLIARAIAIRGETGS